MKATLNARELAVVKSDRASRHSTNSDRLSGTEFEGGVCLGSINESQLDSVKYLVFADRILEK